MTGSITRSITLGFCAILVAALGGCGPNYSPDTYSGAAMQQANKVDTGVVVGYREVKISSDGTVGAVTGGAAGGILGAQFDSPSLPTALAALGGTVVGGVVGTTIEHTTGDTTGWEYIVREPKGDLISVTQREPKPIAIGQKVLVIEGKQARIVPDYATAAFETPSGTKTGDKAAQDKAAQDKPAQDKSATAAAASATNAAPTSPAPDKARDDQIGGPSDPAAPASAVAPATPAAVPDTSPGDTNTQPAAPPPEPPASSPAGEGASATTAQP